MVQFANTIIRQYETAEDIVQECWLHLWTKPNILLSITEDSRKYYVRQCVRNACIDILRKNQRMHTINVEHIESAFSHSYQITYNDVFEQIESLISKADFLRLLNALPTQEKKVVEKKIEGYSTSEISEYLHISTGTVRSYWSRACHRLHVLMETEYP